MEGALQTQRAGSCAGSFAGERVSGVVSCSLKAESKLTLPQGFTWSHCGLASSLAGPWLPRKLLQEMGQPRFLVDGLS